MSNKIINSVWNQTRRLIIIIVVILIVFIVLLNAFRTVKSGEIGIRTRFGKIQANTAVEGINLKIPFIEKIIIVNIKVQKAEISATAASKDLQEISASFAVNYQINATKATELYRNVGEHYESIILQPAIQEAFKATTAGFTAEEMITRRGEISIKVIDLLQEKVEKYGIFIRDLNITNLEFSRDYNAAIESKQVAEQKVKQAEQELAKAKIDAEKKVTEAQAEVEAMKIKNRELTKEILQEQWISKWDGKLPTYTGDANIMLDIFK